MRDSDLYNEERNHRHSHKKRKSKKDRERAFALTLIAVAAVLLVAIVVVAFSKKYVREEAIEELSEQSAEVTTESNDSEGTQQEFDYASLGVDEYY